ncbi:MAG: tyrosine--tRNA ligase [Pseudomonadales bacterium]
MVGDLLGELEWRGLLYQASSPVDLAQHLAGEARTVYCGFDPTAESLHIGNLVPLLALRRCQVMGHRPIVLVGGATGLIGDPSFKAAERQLNTIETVKQWADSLQQQVSRFVDFDCGDSSALLVNNLDWTAGQDVLDFLRDVGKHFSVNAMIQKESVRQRIERDGEGISFTEFAYMVLQSNDFAELNRRYACTVQIGGSDQWGNITGGIDLTRRLNQQQVFGLTLPLITKADGSKFGKTESGTVWLDARRTSPYSFYQFWMNTADADVYLFLRYFSFLSEAEIEAIEAADNAASGRKSAQQVLAQEVTGLVHGDAGVQAAQRISHALFAGEVRSLEQDDFEQLALDGLASTEIEGDCCSLVDVLVNTGLALTPRGEVTQGQARKFIQGNAVSVNGEKMGSVDAVLRRTDALFGRFQLLKRGKKQFHLLRWK